MDPELQAFEDARADRDRRVANEHKPLAEAYLAAHASDPVFVMCAAMNTIPKLVRLLEVAREDGDLETVAKIDVWLETNHEKQQIGGHVNLPVEGLTNG